VSSGNQQREETLEKQYTYWYVLTLSLRRKRATKGFPPSYLKMKDETTDRFAKAALLSEDMVKKLQRGACDGRVGGVQW
jgi:hypothetical protein